MKRTLLALAALVVVAAATPLHAADTRGGLGFHTFNAPIGFRHWLNSQVAIDAGIGIDNVKFESGNTTTDKVNSWTIDVGVPYCFKTWDKVHIIGRPGFEYTSSKDEPNAAPGVTTTGWAITGELEAEVMIVNNVSVSMSHGIEFTSQENDQTPKLKRSGFQTFGAGWSDVGFHVYLW